MYTNIDIVRTMSWLDDEVNITDPNIKDKIARACSMVDSAIWCIYTLPISYRYKNILTFAWAGTWSWTMTITVNWVDYPISIVSWDTPDSAADKFRVAAINSTDFKVDNLGLWEEVTIVSLTNSVDVTTAYDEVNITAAPDTEGITATIWTRTQRYPQTLDQAAAEIATALLFIDIYWIESQDTWKDGETRMDRVNELLRKLQGTDESGQNMKIFDDITYEEITTSDVLHAESYPNDTSDTSTTDPTSPKMFINKEF